MKEKGVVEVRGILQEGSLRNILEGVFGNCKESEREELGNMVKEGYELIVKFNWEDYFGLKLFDFDGVKRKCHKLAGRVRRLVGGIVEERRKRREDLLVEVEEQNDFLSALLSLPIEERLCDSDMVAVLWVSTFF